MAGTLIGCFDDAKISIIRVPQVRMGGGLPRP